MKLYVWIILMLSIISCPTDKQWTIIEANTKDGLHDLEIINEEIIVAYGYGTGVLIKTLDSGKSWEKIYQFDSIYFEQIQFLDENNGWIVGSPNKIYSTQNGGKTWIDKSLEKEYEESYIYGMWFENKKTGYISALQRNKTGYSTRVFETKNGGNSWKSINYIDEMILNLERIDGTLYATGNNVIIKNIDKEDWSYILKDTTKTIGQIRDMDRIETGNFIASSFNGFIIKVTKNSFEKNQITKNSLRNLASISDNEWIAVGDNNKESGNLFVSSDNGETWEVNPDKFSDIHRIEASKKRLWAVGKEGLIMKRKK